MESGLDGISFVGEHDEFLEMIIVAAHEGGWISAVPLVLPARDDEMLDVALAVNAPEHAFARCLGLHDVELVADVLAFHRIVHDTILVRAMDAGAPGLVIDRKSVPFEAAFEF